MVEARHAGTAPALLALLAGRIRQLPLPKWLAVTEPCPARDLAFRLEDAFTVLHKESKSRLPLISARYLAEMYATAQLVDEDSQSAQS